MQSGVTRNEVLALFVNFYFPVLMMDVSNVSILDLNACSFRICSARIEAGALHVCEVWHYATFNVGLIKSSSRGPTASVAHFVKQRGQYSPSTATLSLNFLEQGMQTDWPFGATPVVIMRAPDPSLMPPSGVCFSVKIGSTVPCDIITRSYRLVRVQWIAFEAWATVSVLYKPKDFSSRGSGIMLRRHLRWISTLGVLAAELYPTPQGPNA
jgi:hypothetical protein